MHSSSNQKKIKFAGTYRRHTFVERDFEINTNTILGGGYLILAEDRKSCWHEQISQDYGGVPDKDAVVASVIDALLKK